MGSNEVRIGSIPSSNQTLPGAPPPRKASKKKTELQFDAYYIRPSAETFRSATKTKSPFRLYFQRRSNRDRTDDNLDGIRTESFASSTKIASDTPSQPGLVLLRTKSLVRRTKSMVRRTKSLVKRKLSITPSHFLSDCESGHTAPSNSPYTSNNTAAINDATGFNGPKILKSAPVSSPKKSTSAFYHLFSQFGQVGGRSSPPDSRTASFAFSKSFSFADSQRGGFGGQFIAQENSADFPTLTSPTSYEALDCYTKTFPGVLSSTKEHLHPAVSRAFRFEISDSHMAENTRLTGIHTRRHIAHFQCKTNPDELSVNMDSITLRDDLLVGKQAILRKAPDVPNATVPAFYDISSDESQYDQSL